METSNKMCGIIGLFAYACKTKDLDPRVEALMQRMLFTESLVGMEPRGKDATGISLLWDDYETSVIKQPINAKQFAIDDGLWGKDFENPDDENANFKWFMEKWLRGLPETRLRHAIGHVRAGTKGSEFNPHNNHPIIISSSKLELNKTLTERLLIGVHNGSLKNDAALFAKYKFDRIGEVDSEVIFQLINQYRDELTVENLEKTFLELEGAYNVMAYNPDNLDEVACMRHERPLDGAYIKELGTLFMISEKKFLQQAVEGYERWRIREAGTIITWKNSEGNLEEIGTVYDLFPFLTVDWLTSIDEGVWVLNLSTEVTDKTKCTDLIKVKKVFKVVTPIKPYSATNANWNGVPSPSIVDKRAITHTPPSVPSTSVINRGAPASEEIEDLTDYAVIEATSEETLMRDLLDEVGAEIANSDTPIEFDGSVVEVEVENDEVDESEDSGCPYTWEERLQMAMDSLYDIEPSIESKLKLTTMPAADIRALLDKYLIKTKSDDEAATILASFYDIVIPEGFGIGFGAGYKQAGEDMEQQGLNEELEYDSLRKQIENLENTLKAKEVAITNLLTTVRSIKESKTSASQYVGLMKPLLALLLKREGVINPTTGEYSKSKIVELLNTAGVNQSEAVSNRVISRILGTKA